MPDPLDRIATALEGIAREFVRYNDLLAPPVRRGEAEVFRADYSAQSREQQETHETLLAIEASRSRGRTPARPRSSRS
jgi:hypothetical protein